MCGRYALGIRASFVRHQLEDHDMPVHEAPEDDDVRQSYNFAPGYHGLVYRADVPDWGAGHAREHGAHGRSANDGEEEDQEASQGKTFTQDVPGLGRYKLQSMKWGLVPFWTKRNPDYGSVMKTINARDDSLASKGGMWNTMKQKKRCIVIAQGFYEWLKKNGGKEKIPHFVKRKDDQLMCFAGLWDCVQYEDSDEKHYTYTIITTDSNKQLSFLHDRMPVILENGSEQVRTWLDASRSEWSKDLQDLLKPYDGELECYPVSKDVGKVGNNSPSFMIPVASSENKNNIANFFGNAKKKDMKSEEAKKEVVKSEKDDMKQESDIAKASPTDARKTIDHESTEDNAPIPVPPTKGVKRELDDNESDSKRTHKAVKVSGSTSSSTSPSKVPPSSSRKTRSATSNGTATKGVSPSKSASSQKITAFLR